MHIIQKMNTLCIYIHFSSTGYITLKLNRTVCRVFKKERVGLLYDYRNTVLVKAYNVKIQLNA